MIPTLSLFSGGQLLAELSTVRFLGDYISSPLHGLKPILTEVEGMAAKPSHPWTGQLLVQLNSTSTLRAGWNQTYHETTFVPRFFCPHLLSSLLHGLFWDSPINWLCKDPHLRFCLRYPGQRPQIPFPGSVHLCTCHLSATILVILHWFPPSPMPPIETESEPMQHLTFSSNHIQKARRVGWI